MSNPSETTNAATVRRRLRGPAAAPAAVAEPTPEPVELPEQPRAGGSSALIARPRLPGSAPKSRQDDVTTRTPLPREAPRPETAMPNAEFTRLQGENQELRALIDQAISQEEENDRQVKTWQQRVTGLEEQVKMLKDGAGEAGDLIVRVQTAEQQARVLNEQMQELELQLQLAQEGHGTSEQYSEAIQQRDDAIVELNQRIAELEQLIADVPPAAPTDEELARMADELERERCKITQLKKDFEEQKRQHALDEEEMEKQMRVMEVQLSKERAEMARQRTELQRMQADMRADADSIMLRADNNNIRDRLQQSMAGATPKPAEGTPAKPNPRESGFMTRLFGKK